MGIFTPLKRADIAHILSSYDLALIHFHGVPEGTVNTYYRLDTDRGLYYLRLDERGDENEVKKELALLELLRTLPVPHVKKTRDGRLYTHAHGKPALLFTPLPGHAIRAQSLGQGQYTEIGTWLAKLHATAIPPDLPLHRFHPNTLYDIYRLLREPLKSRHAKAKQILATLFRDGWQGYAFADLPQALIHADLFEENLLFENSGLTGVLDFEAAGRGPRLLDLAIALQALCFDVSRKVFNLDRSKALATAYLQKIPLTPQEYAAWPQILTYSALRFLVTRLKDFELSGLTPAQGQWKDYRDYLDHLRDLPRLYSLLTA